MGNMTESAEVKLRLQQKAWASNVGKPFNRNGYVATLEDNLFEPLEPDSEYEFRAGQGNELDGKMLALHSSSALVVNFFHYWRYRDISVIVRAFDLDARYNKLRFERAYPKPPGIGRNLPQPDVELSGAALKPVAIEAKFLEPYHRDTKGKTLANKYVKTKGIWDNLDGCSKLAQDIVEGKVVFKFLDAPQLLKHIVGLSTETEHREKGFKLIYLWYKVDGIEAAKHKDELRQFIEGVGREVDFEATTYQELFKKVKTIAGGHEGYIKYMQERYFPGLSN